MNDGPERPESKASIQRVDVVCDHFEREWLSGRRPHFAPYLAEVTSTDRPLLFAELLAMDMEYRRKAGEAVAYDDYLPTYPEFAPIIQREAEGQRRTLGAPDEFAATLRSRAASELDASPTVPWQLPGLELLELIGRGGMGVVFRARQVELDREVAVKLILAGRFAAMEQRVRFRLEAEAVASLQHANIVQIYGADEYQDQPYIIMEYVGGESLDRRMARLPFTDQEAASLVESLARGIHLAHLRGIIHRDLKPANILITADGVPKITDFGLAKRLSDDSSQTRSGMLLGSPRYMSPEQANGEVVGPTTDVYALGVILYEMLTREVVFDGETLWQMLEQIKSAAPTPPRKRRADIPRDLETICLKCLNKLPGSRYESAAALADDLNRFQSSRPIRARHVTPVERLRLWARRHPAVAALSCAVVMLALVTIGGGRWYHHRLQSARMRAERRFELANDAINQIMAEIGEDRSVIDSGTDDHRRQMLAKALDICQQLTNEDSADPAAQRRLATAIRRKADVHRLLGEYAIAASSYDRAIRTLIDLRQTDDRDRDSARELATAYNFQGELYRSTGQLERARLAYEASRQIQESLLQAGDSTDVNADLARTFYNLGLVAKATNQLDSALGYFRAANDRLAQLPATENTNARYQQHRARVETNLGSTLRRLRRTAEAAVTFENAMRHYQSLVEAHPEADEFRFELALTQNNLGNLLLTQDSPQAMSHLRDARAALVRLSRQFPQVPSYQQELANTCNGLAAALASQGELAQAEQEWTEAVRSLEHVHELGKASALTHSDLATYLGNLGRLQLKQGNNAQAEATLRRGLAELKPALDEIPESASCRHSLLNVSADLAKSLVQQAKYDASVDELAHLSTLFKERSQQLLASLAFVDGCLRQMEVTPGDPASGAQADWLARYGQLAQQLYQQASTSGELATSVATDNRFAKLRATLATLGP